ncbi:Fic family protein [Pseudomonas syringae]|uniref:Fic family protein n=1 Tax=Pseudomonas syringae TaxID=317 RepID=UPI002009FDC9|nr:Fic family protein [Pseudomonas syringae]MCK9735540.1 Fic family protein [Pseudomonas syringae pv. syringae]MCK9750793.1 Fic family protein [Pseudomonas syringae pv. syringae]MDF7793103.1 Fic family protein [Pseudomonas syringae]
MSSLGTPSTIYSLSPLVYPTKSSLAETTLSALAVADKLLNYHEHIPWPIKLERLTNVLAEKRVVSLLKHPLFAHYLAFNAHVPLHDRTLVELRNYERIYSAFEETLIDINYPAICKFLIETSRLVGGGSCIRDTPIGLKPDSQGRTTMFIDVEEIEGALIYLWHYMAKRSEQKYDPFDALVAIVGLLNCHPFSDGNGRVARVLYNILLARSTEAYIPLYDFYHCTPGGYLLRLRQAQLFGEWDDLTLFHCNIINVMAGK